MRLKNLTYGDIAWTFIAVSNILLCVAQLPRFLDCNHHTHSWIISLAYALTVFPARTIVYNVNMLFITMSKDLFNLILIRLDGCLGCIVDCTSVTEIHKQLHIFIAKYLLFPPIILHVFGGLITLMELRLDVCQHKPHGHHEHTDDSLIPIIECEQGRLYFDEEDGALHIEYDDLFRMILVLTMILGFAWSRSHLLNDMFYSFAQHLHVFLAIAFICDLFRPKPPPHNEVSLASFPGFFVWILNKLIYYTHMYFSPQRLTIVKRIPLKGDYLLLLGRFDNFSSSMINTIGPFFWINFEDASLMEKSHPFDVWFNRSERSLKFYRDSKQLPDFPDCSWLEPPCMDVEDETLNAGKRDPSPMWCDDLTSKEDENNWDIGIVMKTYQPYSLSSLSPSHIREPFTYKVSDRALEKLRFRFSGPYLNEYHSLIPNLGVPTFLICTTAGTAYVLDWLEYTSQRKRHPSRNSSKERMVNIYFVTRNLDLARLLAHMMSSLVIPNVHFHLYYTKVKSEARYISNDKRREIILARPDFREIFSRAQRDTCVYYCGNYRLREVLMSLTKEFGLQDRLGTSLTYSHKRHRCAIPKFVRNRAESTMSDTSALYE